MRDKTMRGLLVVCQRRNLWKKAGLLLSFHSFSTLAMSSSGTAKSSAALVFLHGLGDTPAGWSSLEDQLPQIRPELANVRYEFPAAPTIPITINGGGKWDRMDVFVQEVVGFIHLPIPPRCSDTDGWTQPHPSATILSTNV